MGEVMEEDLGPILYVHGQSGTVVWAPFVTAGRLYPSAAFLAVKPTTVGGPRGTVIRLEPGEFVPAAAVERSGQALQRLVSSGKIVELPGDSGVAALTTQLVALLDERARPASGRRASDAISTEALIEEARRRGFIVSDDSGAAA